MRFLLASCLLFIAVLGYATSNNGITINVPQSQKQIVVSLPSNPTTGYQWVVKQYDQSLFTLMASNYIAPQTQLIGAGGHMVFTFEVVKDAKRPQQSVMEFIYQRPWEKGKGTVKAVTINFK